MQYDMGRFDQPLLDETQPKAHVWTDIGEAEVESSIFGKAKVRVYRKRDEVRDALRWSVLTISVVVGIVWLIHDVSRQPEIVVVAPPPPVAEAATPEPQVPVRAVPLITPRVMPSVAKTPLPQLQTQSAPVATKPVPRIPAVVAGASAPVAARPTPVAVKPAPVAIPVATEGKPSMPAAPAAASPDAAKAPVTAASAVTATN